MKRKLAITAIVAFTVFVFGFTSFARASTNELPVPTLTYQELNNSTIRLFVSGSFATEHHICPEARNKPTGNKLADGSDEWRCDVIKLSGSKTYLDYSLSRGLSERFGVIAHDPIAGVWSKWSSWHKFTNNSQVQPVIQTTITTTASAILLPWRQAGCDDLTEKNKEWRDTWAYTDKYWQKIADRDVDLQNNPSWNILYGEPKDRLYLGYGCNNKLAWKIVKVKVQKFIWQYTLCADGWISSSVGQGTCSWHGGIYEYRGYYKTVNENRIQFYWVY